MGRAIVRKIWGFLVVHLKGQVRIARVMFDGGGGKTLVKAFQLGGGVEFEIDGLIGRWLRGKVRRILQLVLHWALTLS